MNGPGRRLRGGGRGGGAVILEGDPVAGLQVTLDDLASLMYCVVGIILVRSAARSTSLLRSPLHCHVHSRLMPPPALPPPKTHTVRTVPTVCIHAGRPQSACARVSQIAIAASPRYRHLFVRKAKVKEAASLVKEAASQVKEAVTSRHLTVSSSRGSSKSNREWDSAVAQATHSADSVYVEKREQRLQTAAEEGVEGHVDDSGSAAPPSPAHDDSTVLSELLASHREVVKMLAAMDDRLTQGLKQRPKVYLDPSAKIIFSNPPPNASPAPAADAAPPTPAAGAAPSTPAADAAPSTGPPSTGCITVQGRLRIRSGTWT